MICVGGTCTVRTHPLYLYCTCLIYDVINYCIFVQAQPNGSPPVVLWCPLYVICDASCLRRWLIEWFASSFKTICKSDKKIEESLQNPDRKCVSTVVIDYLFWSIHWHRNCRATKSECFVHCDHGVDPLGRYFIL